MKVHLALLIVASTFLPGCNKEDKPDLNETYFFTGTIDNHPIRWEVKATDNTTDTSRYHARAHYFYSQWGLDCATTECYDVAAGIVVSERNKGNAIEVLFLQASKAYDLDGLKPLFTAGFKAFGQQRTSPFGTTQIGILVRYIENGRVWHSEGGDQTGSTFESVAFKEATVDKDLYSHIWRARFSCKVYFSGLPPKTLQNCAIYGPAFF